MRRVLLPLLMVGLAWSAGGTAQEKKAQPKKQPPAKREATPAADLATLPGFKVELIKTADPAEEGSWICMTADSKGRLVIAGQRGQPILRMTLADGKVVKEEKLSLPITEAMGLLEAYDSLYVNGAGPQGFGLYRCTEQGDSGKFDVKFLKKFEGAGEHGPHGLAKGPDGRIYIMNGNHTKLPEGLSPQSPFKNYKEDLLLPRQWDGNGHAAGILAPGGYVVRTDADGKDWELVLAGFRNAYDIAFNTDGELFTFDSDMEWDWGMPWYRPTRVNHCTVGSEHGWRSGTGKWAEYYLDSLPPVVNIGVGSPTGVGNGLGAKFPAKYQRAIYICDWSYGRLMAVHLTPQGSTYTATFENFVAPKGLDGKSPKKPLNLTDVVIGADGAMYFTTGGRNTQAGLYRVTYTGSESTAPAIKADDTQAAARKLRHELEGFLSQSSPKAVEVAWPHLSSPDRAVRFAARLAVESQPVADWKPKALSEKDAAAAFAALLALARNGTAKDLPELLTALEKFPAKSLSDEQKLEKLRVAQVALTRLGPPPFAAGQKLAADIDAVFPSTNEAVNREAAMVLIYLQSPKVLAKCLTLMAQAKTQEDRMFYLFHLRTLPVGFWTLDQRKEYLGYYTKDRGKLAHPTTTVKWFEEAGRGYSDGASFNNFLKNFLKEHVTTLAPAERTALEADLTAIDKASVAAVPDVKPRPFVKQWKADEVVPQLEKVSKARNFEKGREAYLAAQCAKCHRFADLTGGAIGPDLTAISSRFTRRDVLDSILEPSKVVSEQYQNEEFQTADGKVVIGRVVDETPTSIAIQTDPLDPKRVTVKKSDIESRKASKVSPMPANLADVLTAEDLLDLLAYLESGGRKDHPVFKK